MTEEYGLELVTPATAEPVTLADAKAHNKIDQTIEDGISQSYLTAARQYFEEFTGLCLMPTTWQLHLQRLPRVISLVKPPWISLESVVYTDANGEEQTLEADQYQFDKFRGKIYPAYGVIWPDVRPGTSAVKVKFKSGYANAAAVPERMKQAIRMLFAVYFDKRSGIPDPGSVSPEMPFAIEVLMNQSWTGHYF